MPLDEAHALSHVVKDRLMARFPQIADAVIHIEPPPREDDPRRGERKEPQISQIPQISGASRGLRTSRHRPGTVRQCLRLRSQRDSKKSVRYLWNLWFMLLAQTGAWAPCIAIRS